MTQDEIIEMAREAGCIPRRHPEYWEDIQVFATPDVLVKFANLVAAKEREECAKLCENMTLEWEDQPEFARIELSTMMDCALAIRARGEQA